ncbi:MAG: hypothetical protein WC865_16410 [Bacteroidales bacterium]
MNIDFPTYNFPCRLFDFGLDQEIEFENYRQLEYYIQEQLYNNEVKQIKDGLSNVLFWGYYRVGYGRVRVEKFRGQISNLQLQAFATIVKNNEFDPIVIKKLGLPQFSQFSFISKILMFLDPARFVTLDKKIMDLGDPQNHENPLSRIPYSERDTGIRVTNKSTKNYLEWCKLCGFIAKELNSEKIAVDIERGFFRLVEEKRIDYAKSIIRSEIRKLHAITSTYPQ